MSLPSDLDLLWFHPTLACETFCTLSEYSAVHRVFARSPIQHPTASCERNRFMALWQSCGIFQCTSRSLFRSQLLHQAAYIVTQPVTCIHCNQFLPLCQRNIGISLQVLKTNFQAGCNLDATEPRQATIIDSFKQ